MGLWYDSAKEKNQIVIASRVRLARNLSKYPFSLKLDDNDAAQMIEDVKDKFFQQTGNLSSYYTFHDLSGMKKSEVYSLAERYLITPTLAQKKQKNAVILSEDGSESIMLNEDDHIRIQSIFMGDNLERALTEVDRLDDLLAERMEYAYNHKYGYITSCPTGMGTGLRATYMMHLPALEQKNLIQSLAEELNRLGYSLRGLCGPNESYGCIYQISNQKTLGVSEKEIINMLNVIMLQVAIHEQAVRNRMLENERSAVEDKICKSYGILKYGRQFSTAEALEHLSNLRMGLCEGIIEASPDTPELVSVMLQIQPHSMITLRGQAMSAAERHAYRARYIQEHVRGISMK